MATDPLHPAFERFLRDRDGTALLSAVRKHAGRAPANELDYPIAHRICDVELGAPPSESCASSTPTTTRRGCYIYPTDRPSPLPGVPFRLQGAALRRWVDDELLSPTKGPTRWSRYDASLADDA